MSDDALLDKAQSSALARIELKGYSSDHMLFVLYSWFTSCGLLSRYEKALERFELLKHALKRCV